MSEKLVTIKQSDLDKLIEGHAWGLALDSAGVDNWSGCDYARNELPEIIADIKGGIQIFEVKV